MAFHLPQLQGEQVETLARTEAKPYEMDMPPETRCSGFLELAHLVASQSFYKHSQVKDRKRRKESTTESHSESDGNEICRIQRDRTLLSNERRIP